MPGLTELEAVNDMLSVIGEAPVATIEGDLIPDAALAKSILRKVSSEVQERGWHFNTEYDYPLAPDTNGYIWIPNDVLAVDTEDADIDAVVRGDKLYDRQNHTFVFSRAITATILRLLTFTDMPPAARRYITVRATRQFQERALGSGEIRGATEKDEVDARALMVDQELENGDYSMLDNWGVAKAVQR